MKVNNWNCQVIEDAYPLTCPACGEMIPNPNVVNGDFCYSPIWSNDGDQTEAAIRGALGIKDPIAEFFICRTCFTNLNMLPPLMWLEKWIEEDSKLISREKALAILEGHRTKASKSSSHGQQPWYEFTTVDLADIAKPDGDVDGAKVKSLTDFVLNGGVAEAIVLWQNADRLEIVDGRYRVLVSIGLGYKKANAYVLHCGQEDAEKIGRASRKWCVSTVSDGQHRFRCFEFRTSKN